MKYILFSNIDWDDSDDGGEYDHTLPARVIVHPSELENYDEEDYADFLSDKFCFCVNSFNVDSIYLCDLIPSTVFCEECGEEFDTNGLEATLETIEGEKYIVVSCPHCGGNAYNIFSY